MPIIKKLVGLFLSLTLIVPFALADNSAKNTTLQAAWLADYAAMRQLNELAQTATDAENWLAAAKYFERAGEHGSHVPGPISMWMHYFSMESYARAKEHKAAVRILNKAADLGFRFPEYVEGNALFSELSKIPQFEQALSKIQATAMSFRSARTNPEDAKLIFDDVPRFWAAYDLAVEKKHGSQKAAVFREHYLAKGSPGLIDYHWIKTKSMERLLKKIDDSSEFYTGIRAQTLRAASFEPQIREGFKKLKTLYPEAYFPDVTFVIGRLNSGGTAGPSGMLIGLDVWSWTEGVSVEGISKGFQKILKSSSLTRLPYIVVHEHIHSLQAYTGEQTLLRGALQEGSADFLALLALPDADVPPYFKWGYKNEALIWNKFKQEMDGTDLSNWIGNNNDNVSNDWHPDLGYFVGAQICREYYQQAKDKQQAIRDLLFVNDALSILEKSGYAKKFE